MSSYLLNEDGDVLNAEGGDRLVWDALSASVAIVCSSTVTASARRIMRGIANVVGSSQMYAAATAFKLWAPAPVSNTDWTDAAASPGPWHKLT